MVIGIGIDLVHIPSMRKMIHNSGEVFLNRTFSPKEIQQSRHFTDSSFYLSKRFAAKEAVFKALRPLLSCDLDPRSIETLNDENGKPYVCISPNLKECLTPLGITNIHISLTDEEDYAAAFVIIEQ